MKWYCTVTITITTDDDATEDDAQDLLDDEINCAYELDDITEVVT